MSRPVSFILRSGRHPHEIALLVLSVVIGFTGLIFESDRLSPGISNAFPGLLQSYFYFGLVLGGAVALFGALRINITGLLLERAGLIFLSAVYLAYGISVLSNSGTRGLIPALFGIAMSVASIVRVVQIQRDVKQARKAISDALCDLPESEGKR